MSTASHSQTVPLSGRAPLAPGPIGGLFFTTLVEARRDRLAFFRRMVGDYGDYVAMRFGPARYIIVNDPDGVRQVLVDNHKKYTKSRHYLALKLVLGEGLLTSEGDAWRRQRRLAQPAFHRERLQAFAGTMVADTASMLARWSAAPAGPAFDLHQEMMRLTLRIVTRTLFSTDSDGDARSVGRAMSVAIEHVNEHASSILRVPPWVPTPRNLRFARARRTLDSLVLRIIDERRKSHDRPDDLLSLLMSAEDDETHEKMSDRQLRDEVMTVVAAGHETTANALTWTFYLLSKHPRVAERLHRELDDVLAGRTPTLDDLTRLVFTRAVLEEALRLYPPAWIFERQAIVEDVVGGFRVPRDAIVAICPYTMHRNPRYWQSPDEFDPDRFSGPSAAARPKYAYLPFGGGPRSCIGNAFAMMEAQLILAMMAQAWSLDLAPGFVAEAEPSVTLRPRNGLSMTRTRRTAVLSPVGVVCPRG